MKKIIFLSLGVLLFCSASQANSKIPQRLAVQKQNIDQPVEFVEPTSSYSEGERDMRRQCCTKAVLVVSGEDLVIIEATACAGWFLSNDAAAMNRACDKVDKAIETIN